jgi:hypothetical protein
MPRAMGEHFVVDGRHRAERAVTARHYERRFRHVLAARRRYAADFANASRLKRLRLRWRIRRELDDLLREELDRLASPDSSY